MPRDENFVADLTRPWYRRWRSLVLLVVISLVLAVIFWFISIFMNVWGQVRSGEINLQSSTFTKGQVTDMSTIIDKSDPMLGAREAPISIVEFGDFQCPLTRQSHTIMLNLVKDNPKVLNLYWRNFPVLDDMSLTLAKAAECAHLQGRFWVYYTKIFEATDQDWTLDKISALAAEIGMNSDNFSKCLSDTRTMYKVYQDVEVASKLELAGTPTFFVNGFRIRGFVPEEGWQEILKKVIEYVNQPKQ